MQEEINNKISQFVDDELDLQQTVMLMQSIKNDTELKKKINRYQTIGQVLKSEQPVLLKTDFAEQISQQIKQEPVYFIPAKKSAITWKKTSLAVAASLAIAAVLLPKAFNRQASPDYTSTLAVAEQPTFKKNEHSQTERPQLARVQAYPPNQRFNDYLQAHSNSLYTIGASNYQPYARVAGYSQE
ncbi:sigma-E factor negative regulatory protein [Methylomarinum vadi]|uniref:sigma-E factor negative regulatory protein n=1 Tax=Methylomarinum vadi TaxID=438855 RepID=UPI0004DEFEA0|nr:sigma-E factor negative regulatory protein [Methylomarinum vadi]